MQKTFSQSATTALLLGYSDLSVLFLRLAAGGMMLSHGITKLMNFSQIYGSFPDPIGLGSNFSFLLMLLTETVGSLMVICGFITRLAALALVFGMAVAAFIAHAPFTFGGSELPLLYLAAFAAIMIHGGGRYSLDSAIWGRALGNIA